MASYICRMGCNIYLWDIRKYTDVYLNVINVIAVWNKKIIINVSMFIIQISTNFKLKLYAKLHCLKESSPS